MTNEQLEKVMEKQKQFKEKKLTTRQHALKNWLEDNFVSGRFFTIEEIIDLVRDGDNRPYYTLNTSSKSHDKCLALATDVKELNWHTNRERYIPIIKDNKGSIKLCESEQELKDYVEKEKARIERTYQYYNHLNSLIGVDGTTPFINLANRVLEDSEIKPVEVYAK